MTVPGFKIANEIGVVDSCDELIRMASLRQKSWNQIDNFHAIAVITKVTELVSSVLQ